MTSATTSPSTPAATDEILEAIGRFLTGIAVPGLTGHAAFQARVAASAIELVRRELADGGSARARAQAGLLALAELDRQGHKTDLRKGRPDAIRPDNAPASQPEPAIGKLDRHLVVICDAIEAGELRPEDPQVRAILRAIAADQLAIDQPHYRHGAP
jgi:hypothetical protein